MNVKPSHIRIQMTTHNIAWGTKLVTSNLGHVISIKQ